MDKNFKPPEKGAGDLAHSGGKGILGVIPFGGTAAIEVFNSIVKPPYEKRLDRNLPGLDDKIIFSPSYASGLMSIDATGGNFKTITELIDHDFAEVKSLEKEQLLEQLFPKQNNFLRDYF